MADEDTVEVPLKALETIMAEIEMIKDGVEMEKGVEFEPAYNVREAWWEIAKEIDWYENGEE